MADVVIEVMAEANKQIVGDDLNPFEKQIDEVLPSNLERNYSGFLVKKDLIMSKVNLEKLLALIALLRDQLLIAKFVGL